MMQLPTQRAQTPKPSLFLPMKVFLVLLSFATLFNMSNTLDDEPFLQDNFDLGHEASSTPPPTNNTSISNYHPTAPILTSPHIDNQQSTSNPQPPLSNPIPTLPSLQDLTNDQYSQHDIIMPDMSNASPIPTPEFGAQLSQSMMPEFAPSSDTESEESVDSRDGYPSPQVTSAQVRQEMKEWWSEVEFQHETFLQVCCTHRFFLVF